MIQESIQEALEAELYRWSDAAGVAIAWENTPFTPDPEQAYVVPYFMPNVTDSIDLQQQTAIYQGIFQVTVVWPADKGTMGAKSLAASLAAVFPNGWSASVGSAVVFTDRPAQVGAGLNEDVSYNVPVSVYYRCNT